MIKRLILNLAQLGSGEWWVEIITIAPACTYYFGPFSTPEAAESLRPGYIEDLAAEGAEGIQAIVKRCQPAQLTIFDDTDIEEQASCQQATDDLRLVEKQRNLRKPHSAVASWQRRGIDRSNYG